jgi:hypothetical protein
MPAFDPRLLIPLARELAGAGASETRLRSAVNRAYYGLFLLARDKAHLTGTETVHGRTVAAVKAKPGYWATGVLLDEMRHLRVEADYALTPSDPDYADWTRNWREAEHRVTQILPKLEAW